MVLNSEINEVLDSNVSNNHWREQVPAVALSLSRLNVCHPMRALVQAYVNRIHVARMQHSACRVALSSLLQTKKTQQVTNFLV